MFLLKKHLVMLKALVLSFQPSMCKVVTSIILENIYRIILVFALCVIKILYFIQSWKKKNHVSIIYMKV